MFRLLFASAFLTVATHAFAADEVRKGSPQPLIAAIPAESAIRILNGTDFAESSAFPDVPAHSGEMPWSLQFDGREVYLFPFLLSGVHHRWDVVTGRSRGSASILNIPTGTAMHGTVPGMFLCITRTPPTLHRYDLREDAWLESIPLQLPDGVIPASAMESIDHETIMFSASDFRLYTADFETGSCTAQFIAPAGIISLAWDEVAGRLYLTFVESAAEVRQWPGDGALLNTIPGSENWRVRVWHRRFIPGDSWPEVGVDANADGIEDWWVEYLSAQGLAFNDEVKTSQRITVFDALRMRRGIGNVALDVDGDGLVTEDDALSLYNYFIGIGTLPVR